MLAGDLKNVKPALVMTPPRYPSIEDVGLLTVSEIARLNLNADLVILSACNTTSSDTKVGAQGLSRVAGVDGITLSGGVGCGGAADNGYD